MADSTTFHRFALSFQSPWNLASETVHNWANKFSVSGTIDMTQADAETTALALAQPILALASNRTSLISWAYYPSGSKVSTASATYPAGTHPGSQSAYISTAGHSQQLEVCALARAPVGRNSRGKQVYLRKYCHDVLADGADPNAVWSLVASNAFLDPWNKGAGPHSVVPVDPTGGEQGGPWSVEVHLYTHQLRRGSKRRIAAAGTSVLDDIKTLLSAAQLKQLLEELAGAGAA